MGIFDSKEEKQKKEEIKLTKEKVNKQGISNLIDDNDLLKVIVEQNECLIGIAAANAISNAGMVGDAVVVTHTNLYYDRIKQYFKT
jgi:hypothetical protein